MTKCMFDLTDQDMVEAPLLDGVEGSNCARAGFPTATFAVNVTGAFGLGVAGAVLMERLTPRPYMRSLARHESRQVWHGRPGAPEPKDACRHDLPIG